MRSRRGPRFIAHITGRRPDVRNLPVDDDVEREIRAHIDQKIEELIAEGWDREAARSEAILQFGDRDKVEKECLRVERSRDRRLRVTNLGQNLGQDLYFGVRQLIRKPGLALVVMFTLAVGIGPNVAIFSVIKEFLLTPFPYPEPARLVQIWSSDIDVRRPSPLSSPDYFDLREQNTTFEEMGLYTTTNVNVSIDEPELVQGITGTASTLRVFGVQPAAGRLFTEAEEVEGSERVVIISDLFWRERLNSDPDVIGRMVTINGYSHEILGVMPADFEFLSPWYGGQEYQLWTPIQVSNDNRHRDSHSYLAVGRLKRGVTRRRATTDIRAIAARLAEQYPGSNARDSFWLQPFLLEVASGQVGLLIILLGIVGLVLLVACANVASMLLAKGAGRRIEVAIRNSLGASQYRIVAQLLTESLLLSFLGGIAGVLLAFWSIDLLTGLLPIEMQRISAIGIDRGVLFFSVGLTLFTGVVFGLTPALIASRTNVVSALKEAGVSSTGGKIRNRLLKRLAIAQLAIALLMVNGALFLFRSQQNIMDLPLVFNTGQVLTAEIWLHGSAYENDQQKTVLCEMLTARLEALPEVASAAATSKLPLQGGTNGTILVEGESFDPDERRPSIEWSFITAEYFETLGIPLLSGRTLRNGDGTYSERIAVINRSMADLYWPGEDAIGRHVRYNGEPSWWSAVVVGVVEDVRQWSLTYRPDPEMYFWYGVQPRTRIRLAIRSHGDPMAIVPSARRELSALDSDLALSNIQTMEDIVSNSMQERRTITLLVDLFAVITLILSAAGIYGIMSYSVAQRMHEFGVRIALGAARRDLLTMTFRQVLRMVVLAAAFGLFFSVETGFLFRHLIYGVSPVNPLYLLGGTCLVAAIAMLATSLPAFRATRVDPIQSLRVE